MATFDDIPEPIVSKRFWNQGWQHGVYEGMVKFGDHELVPGYAKGLEQTYDALTRSGLLGQVLKDFLAGNLTDWKARILNAVAGLEADPELLREHLALGFNQGHRATADALDQRMKKLNVGFKMEFAHVDPYALNYAYHHAASQVVETTFQQRNIVRNLVENAIIHGHPVPSLAKDIQRSVGLHSRYVKAVQNYKGGLIKQGQHSAGTIERMTTAYANRLRRSRARTIARTEVLRAQNAGQTMAWDQMAQAGFLDRNLMQRKWLITRDEKLCPHCSQMVGARGYAGIYQMFNTPLGYKWEPPMHPNCRCGQTLEVPDILDPVWQERLGIRPSEVQKADERQQWLTGLIGADGVRKMRVEKALAVHYKSTVAKGRKRGAGGKQQQYDDATGRYSSGSAAGATTSDAWGDGEWRWDHRTDPGGEQHMERLAAWADEDAPYGGVVDRGELVDSSNRWMGEEGNMVFQRSKDIRQAATAISKGESFRDHYLGPFRDDPDAIAEFDKELWHGEPEDDWYAAQDLIKAVQASPVYSGGYKGQGRLYRGMALPGALVNSFEVGDTFDDPLGSASANPRVASMMGEHAFGRGDTGKWPVIFRINGAHALHMTPLNRDPLPYKLRAEEYLVGGKYRITKLSQQELPHIEVQLEYGSFEEERTAWTTFTVVDLEQIETTSLDKLPDDDFKKAVEHRLPDDAPAGLEWPWVKIKKGRKKGAGGKPQNYDDASGRYSSGGSVSARHTDHGQATVPVKVERTTGRADGKDGYNVWYGDMTLGVKKRIGLVADWPHAYEHWVYWDGNYDMRVASANIMGLKVHPTEGSTIGDKRTHEVIEFGKVGGVAEGPIEDAKLRVMLAFSALEKIATAAPMQIPLHRGMALVDPGSGTLRTKPGDTFTAPLSAFSPSKRNAESFAYMGGRVLTDEGVDMASVVVTVLPGARAARGTYEDQYQDEKGEWVTDVSEYVTAGEFRVVSHTVTPAVSRDHPVGNQNFSDPPKHHIVVEQTGVYSPLEGEWRDNVQPSEQRGNPFVFDPFDKAERPAPTPDWVWELLAGSVAGEQSAGPEPTE